MERQDIAFLVIAIIVVMVVALIIKPVMSGEEIPFLPDGADPVETPAVPTPRPPTPIPVTSTPVPTETPRWDGKVQNVGFVDPSSYRINLSEHQPSETGQPVTLPPDNRMTTFAVIEGRWSGTTEIITIPYPYWELRYTAEPLTDPGYVYPSINIQVMDATDPNRFVRILNPGILDPRGWEENDPRPWEERFFEGERNYYFVITARFLKSYRIEIMIPERYSGT
ncbi:MAG: hypothetical protein RQ758_02700 [Methanomicrobiaceae archaeon]|nr:hypothetical protein [Methanomicrobiaceae archaeon]